MTRACCACLRLFTPRRSALLCDPCYRAVSRFEAMAPRALSRAVTTAKLMLRRVDAARAGLASRRDPEPES